MPPPAVPSKSRPQNAWLDVVRDDTRANNLITMDAKDRAKYNTKTDAETTSLDVSKLIKLGKLIR